MTYKLDDWHCVGQAGDENGAPWTLDDYYGKPLEIRHGVPTGARSCVYYAGHARTLGRTLPNVGR